MTLNLSKTVDYLYPQLYNREIHIKPRVACRLKTDYDRKIYLDSLLPLEEYDRIIILLSGGKDSMACLCYLLEIGVPLPKLELWHHDIDGGHPKLRMDWEVTRAYCKAVSEAMGIPLRFSWREKGFFGELFRVGSSHPIAYQADEGIRLIYPQAWLRTKEIKALMIEAETENDMELLERCRAELHQIGKRLKFPAKSADLSTRWCSAYLKIMVADSVIGNLESTRENCKILLVSGERREESSGRSRYNEIEIHRKNAEKVKKRTVHQWRPVIDWSESEIWGIFKRHRVNPHPCYSCGWNRCSCSMCIFSSPRHFKGIKEILPERFTELREVEKTLGFTLDNKRDLDQFVEGSESCVYPGNEKALNQLISGRFTAGDVFLRSNQVWMHPAGAFHGTEGGPC